LDVKTQFHVNYQWWRLQVVPLATPLKMQHSHFSWASHEPIIIPRPHSLIHLCQVKISHLVPPDVDFSNTKQNQYKASSLVIHAGDDTTEKKKERKVMPYVTHVVLFDMLHFQQKSPQQQGKVMHMLHMWCCLR